MKIGLIGCGDIARAHATHIGQYKTRHTLVGVCDVDSKKGRAFAQDFGVPGVYEDINSFLQEQIPDVVHVLTPPQTHAALAIPLIEAGCNVLVEKPMALSTREADGIIAAAEANAVKLCVSHNLLFDPVIQRAWTLLRAGGLGKLIGVDVHYGFNIAHASSRDWVEELPGGMLQNLAPHPLYLALDLVGDPMAVRVSKLSTGMLGPGKPDEVRITLEGKEVIGTVAVSLGINPNVHIVRLYGSKAIVHVDLASKILWTERLRSLPGCMTRAVMNLESSTQITAGIIANAISVISGRLKSYQGLGNLIRAFYSSIEQGSPTPVSARSARRVVNVFDRIHAQLQAAVAL
ncbi:Gfo/Idh/MocA family protein [Nitrospira sp. Nam80]